MYSPELHIVQAHSEHLLPLASLFDGYRIFYGQASDLNGAYNFVEQRIVQRESIIFVAMDNQDGQGFVQLYPSFSSVAMQRIWILNDLFVVPTARGQGIATALLQHVEHHARATRAIRVVLSTAVGNAAAQRLYEKLGWQRDTMFYHYQLNVEP
jgi:GNAT superfamily N-acetyltransferase